MGEGGTGGGRGGVRVGWVVGKEGERKEGDFVLLWCSFWLWTRSSWMPFPLLFDAAVWPSIWPCSLVQAWSGMRLLFDRWSHGNQPRWASLDKPILCLHIPCVDFRTRVSSSQRLLPCSPPKVQSAPQCNTLDCVRSYHNVWSFLGMHDVIWNVNGFFLGQYPSSSPLRLRGTFALVVYWLVEMGLSFLEETDAWVWVLGGRLVGYPTLGFS